MTTDTQNTIPTLQGDSDPFVSYTVGSTPEDTFAIPFQFWANGDLTVSFDGVQQIGWNTTGAGNPTGGSLILSDPVSDGILTIQRYVPETRITVFPIAGPFRIEQLNTEFDHLLAVVSDRRFVGENDQVVWDDIVGKPDVVVWDDLYPIGSVHITFVNAPPPRGTWQLITEGTFLLAAGNGAAPGTTGGEAIATATHTLSVNEVPSHSHKINVPEYVTDDPGDHTHTESAPKSFPGGWSDGSGIAAVTQQSGPAGAHTHTINIPEFDSEDAGGGQEIQIPHNNIPPYIAAYMWRRTA